MSERNLEIIREAVAAWNDQDLDSLVAYLDPDIELVPMRSRLEGGTYQGLAGLRQFIGDSADEWDRLRVEVEELRDAGDAVLILGRFQAKGRASGVEMDVPAAWLTELRDGKVTRLRAFPNRDDALRAAGLED